MEIEKMKLIDILKSRNTAILSEYLEYIDCCIKDPLIRRKTDIFSNIKESLKNSNDIGYLGSYSLCDLQSIIEKIEYENTSSKLFSGHRVILYPKTIERISKCDRKCSFSANMIQRGCRYTHYDFLLDDLETKNKYILVNNINIQSEYEYLLPRTINELEEFNRKLECSYTNCDEFFYDISTNLKCEELKIKKINHKKHKTIY